MEQLRPKDRIILAYDKSAFTISDCRLLGGLLSRVGLVKVGLEAMTARDKYGRTIANIIVDFVGSDSEIFWDGKFHDIHEPTVANASRNVAAMGVAMFNMHASAGEKAIAAAAKNKGASKLLGVTVLTSLDDPECVSIFGDKPIPKVLQFAEMLADNGADGIICSPLELAALGDHGFLDKLFAVTPGIRPEGTAAFGQKRFTTPAEAVRLGATYIVVGSPIMKNPNSVKAADDIAAEIASVETK